jgi:hypothetical protein
MKVENEVLKQSQSDTHHLTQKETRQIVTPYAFHVSPELFGTALARPMKRAIAIGIDALLIAMLSQAASFLLAGVAAVTFFRAGNRLKLRKRFNGARLALRFVAATLLFVFALGIFNEFEGDKNDNITGLDSIKQDQISGIGAIAVVAITTKYMLAANKLTEKVDSGECVDAYACWLALGDEFVEKLSGLTLAPQEAISIIRGFVDIAQNQLSEEQKTTLLNQWRSTLDLSDEMTEKEQDTAQIRNADKTIVSPILDNIEEEKEKSKGNGVIAWLQALLEDLGLGFGWAAFYFSIFTAWWQGQTPGKKMLGIKVIKLDGREPNLWESFGRYGGYGAGFATGLLGFLQVYWDPNRQAIQDKISETLVIDLRIAKVNFVPEQ